MPNGFDVIDGSELLSAWTQGGMIPTQHESQSRVLLMTPAASASLRALAVAAKEGRLPPGLLRQVGADLQAAFDSPVRAPWREVPESP